MKKNCDANQGYFPIALETSHWGQFPEPCKNYIEQWDSVRVPALTREIS